MRIYVSGPVTGIPGYNLPAFEAAADKLRKAGYRPLVPHDFVDFKAPWKKVGKSCIETLLRCEGVAMLDGWRETLPAMVEYELAMSLDIDVRPLTGWIGKERP